MTEQREILKAKQPFTARAWEAMHKIPNPMDGVVERRSIRRVNTGPNETWLMSANKWSSLLLAASHDEAIDYQYLPSPLAEQAKSHILRECPQYRTNLYKLREFCGSPEWSSFSGSLKGDRSCWGVIGDGIIFNRTFMARLIDNFDDEFVIIKIPSPAREGLYFDPIVIYGLGWIALLAPIGSDTKDKRGGDTTRYHGAMEPVNYSALLDSWRRNTVNEQ